MIDISNIIYKCENKKELFFIVEYYEEMGYYNLSQLEDYLKNFPNYVFISNNDNKKYIGLFSTLKGYILSEEIKKVKAKIFIRQLKLNKING